MMFSIQNFTRNIEKIKSGLKVKVGGGGSYDKRVWVRKGGSGEFKRRKYVRISTVYFLFLKIFSIKKKKNEND